MMYGTIARRLLVGILLSQCGGYVAFAQYRIHTVVGNTRLGDGGSPLDAILQQPEGIAAGLDGSIYVSEAAGHRVRRIFKGVISTIAGNGTAGFSGDGGPASESQLSSPYGLATDLYGNLYIADLGNARVRKIALDGTISTVAGGGELPPGGKNEGVAATSVALRAPRNVAAAIDGSVYFSDFTRHRVFRVAPDGALTTIAGTGVAGFSGDGGPASAAQLNYPAGLALNFRGLYIADSQNGVVRRVALSNGSSTAPIDTFAHITTPTGMAFDVYGALRVVDAAHGTLTQFLSTGAPTTVKLPADDLTVDLNGSLLVTDAANGLIRSIALDGSIGILAGGSDGSSVDGHSALEVTLKLPGSVAVDPSGNLYIADRGNHRVVKVNANGTAAHISELPSVADPASVRVDAAGNLLVTDEAANRVYSITPTGVLRVIAGDGTPGDSGDNGPASAAQLKSPATAIADGKGNIYIADRGNGRIRQADSAGVIRNLLSGLAAPRGLALDGLGNLYFVENDAARVSRLDLSTGLMQAIGEGVWKTPLGISAAFADGKPTGDVYVADSGREQIFHVAPSGEIDAVAGSGAPGSSDDGSVATAALLGDPSDVAIGSDGSIYFVESGNGLVRKLNTNLADSTMQVVRTDTMQPGALTDGLQIAILHSGVRASDAPSVVVFVNATPAEIVRIDDNAIIAVIPAGTDTAHAISIVVASASGIAGSVTVPGG